MLFFSYCITIGFVNPNCFRHRYFQVIMFPFSRSKFTELPRKIKTYCWSNSSEIVLLSLLNNSADNFIWILLPMWLLKSLLHYPIISKEIKTLSNRGRTALLSLGGSIGNDGFTTDDGQSSCFYIMGQWKTISMMPLLMNLIFIVKTRTKLDM